MIAKLSRIIADFFVRQKVVPEEQREVYEYGFELSISSVIGILIVLAIGLVSRRFWESVVFYIVFCFTRLFTGGYHAPNHILCKVTFAGVLLAVLAADWLLKEIENYLGEYNCWVDNGQYFTIDNGEICQVINLDEAEWEISTFSASSDWSQGPVVDISDGREYAGRIDMTDGDDSTPIFIGYTNNTSEERVSYTLKTGYIFPMKYRIRVHSYSNILREWISSEHNVTFSLASQNKVLFSGQTGEAPSKVCVTFVKDLSHGETAFNYWFQAT